MAKFRIEPNDQTLHGFFSRDLPPVLTIDPGDSVHFRAIDAEWGLENFSVTTFDGRAGPPERKIAEPKIEGPGGHALCGPVFIRGAQPGMTLAIHVDAIRPGTWGWTVGGARYGGDEHLFHLWTLDPDTLTGRDQFGHQIKLKPFMGVMGVAPAESGQHVTFPPRIWGGNIDCKELTAESTLYLPVGVPGALFSTGDGHALQGDGEISSTAIECPMEVDLTFELLPNLGISTPRIRTANAWITLGFHENLNDAANQAVVAMLDLMMELHPELHRANALALASVAVDLRITQIVNGVRGVHAVLRDDAIVF